jgi:hypothetical protein
VSNLKETSYYFTFDEEVQWLIVQIRSSKDIRILEHLLSCAEYQFGKGVGKHYREREDGERISNLEVEIENLNDIITVLAGLYLQNNSLSNMDRSNMAFPYIERSLSILNPWVINLDSDSSNGNNSLSKGQIERLLDGLIFTSITWQQHLGIEGNLM